MKSMQHSIDYYRSFSKHHIWAYSDSVLSILNCSLTHLIGDMKSKL